MTRVHNLSSPPPHHIWLDITTAASWSRPPVGIVRAEVEFARYLSASFPATSRFCVFSGTDLTYHEISLRDCLSLIEALQRPRPEAAAPQANQTSQRSTLQRRLRSALKSLASLVPQNAQRWLVKCSSLLSWSSRSRRPVGEADNFEALNGKAALRHKTLNGLPFNVAMSHQSPNPFSQGDVFVSMGIDWDQKDLAVVSEIRKRSGLRVVWFCYDLIPIKLPHLCFPGVSDKFSLYFKNVAGVADLILCISVSTMKDLAGYLSIQECHAPRLDVIRLGCALPPSSVYSYSQKIDTLIRSKKYLLYVSTIERRKNHETLYRAYVQLIESGLTDLPPLVFIGMRGWGVSDFLNDLQLDHRVKDKIILLTDVSDNDLATLYRACYFTLYPSLYEGWGLPVAESLAFGKFCLASNSSSIPEIAGSLLEYLDPWDVPNWADRIRYYILNPAEVQRREEAIRQEYRVHSWDDSGASIYAACASLIEAGDTTYRRANA